MGFTTDNGAAKDAQNPPWALVDGHCVRGQAVRLRRCSFQDVVLGRREVTLLWDPVLVELRGPDLRVVRHEGEFCQASVALHFPRGSQRDLHVCGTVAPCFCLPRGLGRR